MPNLSSLQAFILAIVAQAVTLVVSFGVLSSTEAGVISSAAVALINAAFLLAHSVHANAAAKVKVAQLAAGK